MLPLCGCSGSDEPSPDDANLAAVHGSVVIDGEPVNAAAILLTPGGGVKITGSDGLYDFTGLTPGKYELKVFKEGCQTQNSSIELTAGRNEELVFTLAKSIGGLSINKSYIDMGSNESNNVAGFTIKNEGQGEITWEIANAARWITKVEPATGSSPAGGATAVSFTIDRSRLSNTSTDNYATLLVRSTTQGDGSVAELLVTVFGTGNGTNTTNDNSDTDYVMVGDLYVQTKDMSNALDWESAKLLCESSIVGNFDDWRLPTIEELAVIYNNKAAIGGFIDMSEGGSNYWSSSPSSGSAYYYFLDFKTGRQSSVIKSAKCHVRAVRKDAELEAPTVITLPVTDISEKTAVLHGSIESEGNPAYTERGFVYSTVFTSPTVESDEKIIVNGTGIGEFFANLSGLTTEINYHVRAFATNSKGITYGETVTFRTGNPDYVILEDAGIMVQRYDISDNEEGLTWEAANVLCENSIVGGYTDWRLPTIDELATLYVERNNIGNFVDEYRYWSGTKSSKGGYYSYDFFAGEIYDYSSSNYKRSARAVRSLP